MKKFLVFFAALFAAATPALAAPNSNFVGPRVEVTAGVDDLNKRIESSDVNYGLGAGVDLPLGDRLTVGAEVNADNFANYRDFGAAARLGLAVSDNVLLYGTAGYAKFRSLDGIRVGGGAEFSTGTPFYGKVEYRYSDFQNGIGRHSGLVGVGLRF